MHMKRKHKKRKGTDLPVLAGCAEYSGMTPMAAINYLSINGFLLGHQGTIPCGGGPEAGREHGLLLFSRFEAVFYRL